MTTNQVNDAIKVQVTRGMLLLGLSGQTRQEKREKAVLRSTDRPELKDKMRVSITHEGYEEKVVILLCQELSEAAVIGLMVLALEHAFLSTGWTKGCQASPPPIAEIMAFINNRDQVRSGYNGSSGDPIQHLIVSSTKMSVKTEHKNANGETVSFQVGGFLDRHASPGGKDGRKYCCRKAKSLGLGRFSKFIGQFYAEMRDIAGMYMPLCLSKPAQQALANDPGVVEGMGLALNNVTDGPSKLMIHGVNAAVATAIIAGGNVAPESRGYGVGEYYLADGNINKWVHLAHCTSIVSTPWYEASQQVLTCPGMKQANRFSHVLFSRQKPVGLWSQAQYLRRSGEAEGRSGGPPPHSKKCGKKRGKKRGVPVVVYLKVPGSTNKLNEGKHYCMKRGVPCGAWFHQQETTNE